jgi:hypothetical protein
MVVLFPAAIVKGIAGGELRAKTAPVIFSCDTETLVVVEVLLSVTDFEPELPIAMLPKLTEAGDAEIVPGVEVVPDPESAMLKLEFTAFDVTFKVPVTAPLAVGEKVRLSVVLVPGAIDSGNEGGELTPNVLPVTVN